MKRSPVNISASVMARLKAIADKEHFDFNFLLVRYIQERFLSRLAVSEYVNTFVLKGGFLLLAYNVQKARSTRDIDFLGMDVDNDREKLVGIVREIARIDLNDGVQFVAESIKGEAIKEHSGYEGIRMKVTARIGSSRNTIQIDFAFGDSVSPPPAHMDYPTLLGKHQLKVLAYSKETIIAEKFEAIVKLTTFNTRMKDFYDISFLATEFDYDGSVLQAAIRETFVRRQTSVKVAAELLTSDFGDQGHFRRQWEAFKKRSRISSKEDFVSCFGRIRAFLSPVIKAELDRNTITLTWKGKLMLWE